VGATFDLAQAETGAVATVRFPIGDES
jgi:hypothetical protein